MYSGALGNGQSGRWNCTPWAGDVVDVVRRDDALRSDPLLHPLLQRLHEVVVGIDHWPVAVPLPNALGPAPPLQCAMPGTMKTR